MLNNSFVKELEKESLKYVSPKWDNMSIFERWLAINHTLKVAAKTVASNRLHVKFAGETLEFNPIHKRDCTIGAVLSFKLRGDCDGLYDSVKDVIKIDIDLVRSNNGATVFQTIMHEFAHKLERELVKQRLCYEEGSTHRKYLDVVECNLASGRGLTAFGIDCGDRLYVENNAMTLSTVLNNKKSMLYGLLTSERHAFSMSESICGRLFDSFESNKYLDALHEFRRTYHCMHLSNDQITNILDSAQMHIVCGTPLRNSYEAIVAYDMAATLALQNKTISVEQYVYLERDELIAKAIGEHGYDIPWKIHDGDLITVKEVQDMELCCDMDFLERMSASEQLMDPEMIFHVATVEMDRIFGVLKDVDSLKQWYYSNGNHIPVNAQEDIAVCIGYDFSPNVREQKMAERGLRLQRDEKIVICDWNYIKSFNNEFDFCNDLEGQNEQDMEIER